MKIKSTLFFLFFYIAANAQVAPKKLNITSVPFESSYAKYVNPMIGTSGHGHTYPGAAAPFGMVQLSPDTRIDGSWDGCSGYHYSDSIIYGFSHTHLSGTGCSDYGDISIMPVIGAIQHDEHSYAAGFKHKNEKATAGNYSVLLNNNIHVDLTATQRVGMHRYQFLPSDYSSIVLDLEHRDKALDYFIKIINDTTIAGYRISEAWAKKQEVYFYITFSKPFTQHKWLINDTIKPTNALQHGDIKEGHFGKIALKFDLYQGGEVLVKVAISSVNEEGAKKNMIAEIPHWDFDKVSKQATKTWDSELAKIEISGSTPNQKTIFYTALYHCFLQPNIYNDVDGNYRGRDGKVHVADGFNYYSVFSLWDTFRAWHPLMTIIDKKRTSDFIKTFLAQYEQGGLLPVWELSCNETECMIGYHSVSVIADAVSKGIVDFDVNKALEAMKKSAETRTRFGLNAYIEKGCLSIEDEHESVSKTLEYAYDDWCIAQVAQYLNKPSDYNNYMQRSQSWKNLFDANDGFIKAKKNGNFITPFDPNEVNNYYTEANGWQYTFFVPQGIPGMINKFGGNASFEKKLDQLFAAKTNTTGREQVDITGLIGQYAHGNEPSHHIAYLYNTIGKPHKTSEKVNQILSSFYSNNPDGLIGNEDCGQMSAWYVLSSLGLYQICPGNPEFEFTTPLFDKAVIHLENKKNIVLINQDKNKKGIYLKTIQSSLLNRNLKINYNKLENGGIIGYTTTAILDSALKAFPRNYPAIDSSLQIVINPLISASENPFIDKSNITLKADNKTDKIYYTTNGSNPTISSTLYTNSFFIEKSTTIKAIAINKNKASKIVSAYVHQLPHPNWKIILKSTYNKQYSAGGDAGIIDGLYGEPEWRKGDWQGYQNEDFEAIINLNAATEIKHLGANFLQDTRSWIIFPQNVNFETSMDGENFTPALFIQNKIDAQNYTSQTQALTGKITPTNAKYVKIKAKNYGLLPSWHQGAGGQAFIFIDEIIIE